MDQLIDGLFDQFVRFEASERSQSEFEITFLKQIMVLSLNIFTYSFSTKVLLIIHKYILLVDEN